MHNLAGVFSRSPIDNATKILVLLNLGSGLHQHWRGEVLIFGKGHHKLFNDSLN